MFRENCIVEDYRYIFYIDFLMFFFPSDGYYNDSYGSSRSDERRYGQIPL